MTKKHFIALADTIRTWNECAALRTPFQEDCPPFTLNQLSLLADYCAEQNPRFNRDRWLNYIAGNCGKNGGKVKVAA